MAGNGQVPAQELDAKGLQLDVGVRHWASVEATSERVETCADVPGQLVAGRRVAGRRVDAIYGSPVVVIGH